MKKRLLALLLAAVSMFQISGTVLASDKPEEYTGPIAFPIEDDGRFDERGRELLERGNELIRERGFKYITDGLPHYYQDDSRWSSKVIENKDQTYESTMGAAGCAIASVAMCQNYLAGFSGTTKYNPYQIYQDTEGNAFPMMWYEMPNYYDMHVTYFKNFNNISATAAAPYVAALIEESVPVIIGLKKASTGKTHFVVARGYSGSTVYIYDPQKSVNKATLAQYSSMFDGIYQIIAYDNDALIDSWL